MKIHILSLVTNQVMSPYASVGDLVPPYELKGPRYWELTISMAECEELALMTIARMEK